MTTTMTKRKAKAAISRAFRREERAQGIGRDDGCMVTVYDLPKVVRDCISRAAVACDFDAEMDEGDTEYHGYVDEHDATAAVDEYWAAVQESD